MFSSFRSAGISQEIERCNVSSLSGLLHTSARLEPLGDVYHSVGYRVVECEHEKILVNLSFGVIKT